MAFTPNSNIDVIMRYVLKNIADDINKEANRINHVFGGPYRWTIISNQSYFFNVIRYIVQNPIRADICKDIRNYKYMLINWENLDLGNYGQSDYIKWFNSVPSECEREAIGRGLKRGEFQIAIDKGRKKIKFDNI